MNKNTRKILELFVEKAAELKSGGFEAFAREDHFSVRMKLTHGKLVDKQAHFPSTDAVKALILTLRFFIQDNEKTSIHNMQKTIDADSALSPNWKDHFLFARTSLNQFLDAPTHGFSAEKEPHGDLITSREVLETFLYGDLAHANEKRRAQYQAWKETPFFFGLIETVFMGILVTVIGHIEVMADITQLELSGQSIPALASVS